ncbi:MAG: MGDG synthase family glycosyltransferase [Streptosporangiaceae bacterium]
MTRANSCQLPATAPGLGETPVPLLFLTSATGGGHRAAATAVAEAMGRRYPGKYVPVLFDPLAGPGSAWPSRWIADGYGSLIRYAPRLWGLLYRATDSPRAARLVQQAAAFLAGRVVAEAVAAHRPALIVSFHPLIGQAAIRARDAGGEITPVVMIITDLGPPHATWTCAEVDRVVPASAIGVPVGSRFLAALPGVSERAAQRRRLGHPEASFLVLLVGGAEGAGKLARRATAIVRHLPDVDVAVICGRNRLLRRRLSRLAARYHGRLSVHGFVTDMGSWLRAADVVATKAGPATIAEAACCGTAMVLTCYLPGQERNNVGFVTEAGAGVYWPRVGQLAAGIGRLRQDTTALALMRAAAARLARPQAADGIADLLAEFAEDVSPAGQRPRSLVLFDGHDG